MRAALAAAGGSMMTRLGVSARHYVVLVRLFRALGERKELHGNLGMNAHAMHLTSLTLLLPGALLAMLALGEMPLATYSFVVLGMSSFILLLLLVIEATSSFLNPAEMTVLAHRPVSGATYFAAKFTYLVFVVVQAQAALNVPPALAALLKPGARWFYPATHMLAALTAGVLLALAICGMLGVLIRFVPAARLRDAGLWMQIAVTTLPLVANLGQQRARRLAAALAPNLPALDWSFLPLTWFHAVALAGHGGSHFVWGWSAAAGLLVSAAFVAFGIRALSVGYMTRIVGAMRGRRSRPARRFGPSAGSRTVRLIAGRPSAAAAWGFMWRVMRREWQFRQAIVPVMFLALIAVPAVVASGRARSPFEGGLAAAGLLPEFLSFGVLSICVLLPFSDHHRGAWVFSSLGGQARPMYVRGIYWSMWLALICLPLTVLATYLSIYWGALDALLFAAYGMSAATMLLGIELLFVGGLPFGSPPRPERAQMQMPAMLFAAIFIGAAWALQGRFVFASRRSALVATVVCALLALASSRLGWRVLDRRIAAQLEAPPAAGTAGGMQGTGTR